VHEQRLIQVVSNSRTYDNVMLSRSRLYLSEVGKISGVYRKTIEKAPVMPNLPIVLSVVFNGRSETPSASTDQQQFGTCVQLLAFLLPTISINSVYRDRAINRYALRPQLLACGWTSLEVRFIHGNFSV